MTELRDAGLWCKWSGNSGSEPLFRRHKIFNHSIIFQVKRKTSFFIQYEFEQVKNNADKNERRFGVILTQFSSLKYK